MGIQAIIGAVAVGVSAVGVGVSMYGSSQQAKANQDIASQQQQANQISLQAMEVESHRRQLETVRQGQIARSQSTAVATSQNAQLGSGLPGAQAQVTGEQNYNMLGLNQNLDLGKEMNTVNNNISQDRMSLASAQGISAFGSGLTSLGNIGVSTFGSYNRLSQFAGFGGSQSSGTPQYGSASGGVRYS